MPGRFELKPTGENLAGAGQFSHYGPAASSAPQRDYHWCADGDRGLPASFRR